MKSKTIGIIGGAGPMAGAYLLERVIYLAGKIYGCHEDADFPKVLLVSFPFSDMLSVKKDDATLRKELKECLTLLRRDGASVIAIACNTLHAFLDAKEDLSDIVHLPCSLVEAMPLLEKPLVLCTSTSRQLELHRKFFPCIYPDSKMQIEVDNVIDLILKGTEKSVVIERLTEIIRAQDANTIVLGCTELSLFYANLPQFNKLILDPLEIVATKLLKRSFLGE